MKNRIYTGILGCALAFLSVQTINAQSLSEWRGEGRKGIYACENMLPSWPEDGPALLWMKDELPRGFSSVSFNGELMYLSGIEQGHDVLVALDDQGRTQWKTVYGRAWTDSYSDSRSTPTVLKDQVYVCSGMGDLACVDARSGEILWAREASKEFGGTYGHWGMAESLLVDGDLVFFTPGGPETTTIALNRKNGELVWKTESLNDNPAYVSPILIEHGGRRLLVNVTGTHVFGVDVKDGSFAWTLKHSEVHPEKSIEVWEDAPQIKCVSPIYHDNEIFITGGYDHGAMKLALSERGDSAWVVWYNADLDVHHGGAVLLDGKIYGSNWLHNGDGNWCCIDWETGETDYEEHWMNKGSIISAGGKLIVMDEKRGNVGLVAANPDRFDLISTFRITEGSGPHWAHPVVHQGKLFLRHGEALMVYDITGEEKIAQSF